MLDIHIQKYNFVYTSINQQFWECFQQGQGLTGTLNLSLPMKCSVWGKKTLYRVGQEPKNYSFQWTFSSRWVGSDRLWWDLPRHEILVNNKLPSLWEFSSSSKCLRQPFPATKGVERTVIKLPEGFESFFSKVFVLLSHMRKQFYRDQQQHKAESASSTESSPLLLNNSGASWMEQFWLDLIQGVPHLSCFTHCIFIYHLLCFLLTYSSVQPQVKWFIFPHYKNSCGNNIQRSLLLGNKMQAKMSQNFIRQSKLNCR